MSMFLGEQLRKEQGTLAATTAEALRALPQPNDSSVQVSVSGGELVAVLRFEGFITPETAAAARSVLLAALKNGVQGRRWSRRRPFGGQTLCFEWFVTSERAKVA